MTDFYGTEDGLIEYAEEKGVTIPDLGANDSIDGALLRGSMYIDAVYGYRFSGMPVDGIDQDRYWPAEDAEDIYGNAIPSDVVPKRVVQATYEAALLELQNPGSLAVLTSENERIRSIKAGSVAIEYAQSAAFDNISGAYPMYTTIEGLLYPLIGGSAAAQLPGILVV